MDWLHCNLCFLQPGDGLKFSLTSCGHIYCANCVETGAKEKCRMCAAKCSTIPLTGKLKPDVEVFFTDPMDLLRKYQKQVAQVFDFQKNHRKRLISHIRDKLQKQEDVARKAEKYNSCVQGLEREVIKLREENSYLKRLISEKGLGSHSRPATPGKLSSSPVHRASPGQSPLTYLNRINSALQSQFGSQTAANTPPCSIAPGRVSVRTPPCGGRIGTIRGTPVQMDTHYTPMSVPHPINFVTPSPTRHAIR